jgi:cytochrome c biogenesis protein CcmG/thiol:disulfide interchange protein DsbE
VLSPPLSPPLRSRWACATSDNEVALSELRGLPVVVNFWASWCDPCRREAALLERAWRRDGGQVLFLGVDQDDAHDDALSFLDRFRVTCPALREAGNATAARWGVGGFPVTFFIDPGGRVVAQTIGQLRPGRLERGITAARTGRL